MILGLLLVGCAVGLGVNAVLENTSSIGVDLLGSSFSLSPGWLFVIGIGTGVVGLLGLSMVVTGLARARRRRASAAESRENLQSLKAERDRLAVELERERNARTTTTGVRNDRESSTRDSSVRDRDASVIDVSDDRTADRTVDRPVDRTPADHDAHTERSVDERTAPVGSDRHGLFQRRH